MSKRLPPGELTEKEFQAAVVKAARDFRWGVTFATSKSLARQAAQWGQPPLPLEGLVHIPVIAYRSEPGWPDLTLVRRHDRRLIFAENKTVVGDLSARQTEVLDLLRCLVTPTPLRTIDGRPCWCVSDDAPHPGWHHAPRCELQSAMPRIAVHVWRPADMAEILEELR